MTQTEKQYDFAGAKTELEAKLPEDLQCALECLYDIAGRMVGSDLAKTLDHLVTEHGSPEAAEFGLAVMKFIVYASSTEAAMFAEHDVKCRPRFDAVGNAKEIIILEELILTMRTEAAVIEGAGRVRH